MAKATSSTRLSAVRVFAGLFVTALVGTAFLDSEGLLRRGFHEARDHVEPVSTLSSAAAGGHQPRTELLKPAALAPSTAAGQPIVPGGRIALSSPDGQVQVYEISSISDLSAAADPASRTIAGQRLLLVVAKPLGAASTDRPLRFLIDADTIEMGQPSPLPRTL